MAVTYATCKYKLHNPSKHKRAMLLNSMKRAHRAYDKVMATIWSRINEIAGDDYTKCGRAKAISQIAAGVLRPLPISSASKCAIQIEAKLAVELYVSRGLSGIPIEMRMNDTPDRLFRHIDDIKTSIDDGDDLRRAVLTGGDTVGRVRPMSFYQNRIKDGVVLYMDKLGRMFAWVALHSAQSKFASPVDITDMIDTRTGEIVTCRSSLGALFPLECGDDYHMRKFMKKGKAASSLISYDGMNFYLHVTYRIEVDDINTETYMGIDRGINNLAAFSVIDALGFVKLSGIISGTDNRKRTVSANLHNSRLEASGVKRGKKSISHISNEFVHRATNAIVRHALKYKSQVVLETLSGLKTNFSRHNALYGKLKIVLEYKLTLNGLPKPIYVSASYTSQTCWKCGNVSKLNRPKTRKGGGIDMSTFKCVSCGHESDADINASSVIAVKGVWYSGILRQKKTKLSDKDHFNLFISDCAKKRDMAPDRTAIYPSVPFPAPQANDVSSRCAYTTTAWEESPTSSNLSKPSRLEDSRKLMLDQNEGERGGSGSFF